MGATETVNDRPDALDELNAFRAGFRHGQDVGAVSPREAETILRGLGLQTSSGCVDCFGNGAEDGRKGDRFRYLLSFALQPKAGH